MKDRGSNKKKLRRQARAVAAGQRRLGGPAPVRFSLMAKPVGPACNLRCDYCFYLEKDALFGRGKDCRMSDEVLEALVRKYIRAEPSDEVTFHWQGGEPTLAGLDFYGRALELQRRYAGGKRIHNTLQTNGTLLDDEWGRLLRQGRWLVGLSLDGPAGIHNTHRLSAGGEGSFDAVMRGLEVLKKHRIEFNVLASVTPTSAAAPLPVYRFLRDAGVTFIQFTPIVERMPDAAARELGLQLAVGIRAGAAVSTTEMTPWSVAPAQYGQFLCTIFDEWVRRDVGSMFVMNFEWALATYMDRPAQVCQFMPACGRSLIIEHNGDIYACDHYVYPEYRLGNILPDDLQTLVQSAAQQEFGKAKAAALPSCCRECPVLPACWGECPKRRFLTAPGGERGLNYLCPAYKKFFTHARPYLASMARLVRAGQPAARILDSQIVVAEGRVQ
jgi:uncharacterized protein